VGRRSVPTPGVNFINVLRARFLYKILVPKLQSCVLGLKLEKSCQKQLLYEKRWSKTLMKLTAVVMS